MCGFAGDVVGAVDGEAVALLDVLEGGDREAQGVVGGDERAAEDLSAGLVEDGQAFGGRPTRRRAMGGLDAEVGVEGGEIGGKIHGQDSSAPFLALVLALASAGTALAMPQSSAARAGDTSSTVPGSTRSPPMHMGRVTSICLVSMVFRGEFPRRALFR
ncbi:hypothetical protein EG878_16585 [Enterococcus faecalis]|nr:hypothetical protein EG878_16585 [Enterococcus faecalis]